MALASICLRGFRNLEPTSVDFADGSNYLFGPNGAGKTNLLEAIHYLAIGRSFRRCPDAELLGFGRDVLVVSGTDESGDKAEIRFDGREKRILRNNIPVEKLSEYFGWLPVVVLLLEDIELVRGAPSLRRGYLDMAVAKAEGGRRETGDGRRSEEQGYIALTGEYRRAVSQYNRLLERGERGEGRGTGDEVAAWEEELVRAGVPVYEARLAKVGTLLENAAKHYERLAGHRAVFSYRVSIMPEGTRSESANPRGQPTTGQSPDSLTKTEDSPSRAKPGDSPQFCGTVPVFASQAELAGAFRQRLAATRERARYLGHAVVGPHRDDIRIMRGDRELRKFGSVGEQRLAGIALRLAEADMILSAGRQRPVFLLDEVASELDEQRSRLVLAMVAERGQMVYAAARRIAPQVRIPHCPTGAAEAKDKGRNPEGGTEEAASVHDGVASLGPLTPGPLDPFLRKEFHVEVGKVSQVS